MKILKSKKGFQLVEIPTLVIVLMTIAIILGISATILGNVQDISTATTTTTAFDSNNTFTALNSTAVDFHDTALNNDAEGETHLVSGSCTGVAIVNVSNVDITTDFTISGCSATLNVNSQNNTVMTANYTYTYNVYEYSYNITRDGINSTEDLSGWQGTWVVIIAAAVVLGIVGRYLFFR